MIDTCIMYLANIIAIDFEIYGSTKFLSTASLIDSVLELSVAIYYVTNF